MNSNTYLVHTYLKNTDLHSLSAYEAITTYLHDKSLHRLKRYTRWEITFSPQEKNSETALKHLLEESFSILNINKEAYFTGPFNEHALKPNEQVFRIEVFPNTHPQPQDENGLMQSIFTKTGLKLIGLKKTLVWEISVIDSRSKEIVQADILNRLILTTSRQLGLLVSPLYETARFI